MALSKSIGGPERILLGEHPKKITLNSGFQQPKTVRDMIMQLELLEDAVKRHFQNESPQMTVDNADSDRLKRLRPFQDAERLVLKHGSLTKIKEEIKSGILSENETSVLFAIAYLNSKGAGSENIFNLRQAIKREIQAEEQIINADFTTKIQDRTSTSVIDVL